MRAKPFARARQPEQRQARRSAILSAARVLVGTTGPMSLSLNELGRCSLVSKPNIYRYFESREDVLVTLCLEELEQFIGALQQTLPHVDDRIDAVAEHLVQGYCARPLMCQLLGMLSPVLEHNLSVARLTVVKRDMCSLTFRAAGLLGARLPWLGGDATWVIQSLSFHVASLWPAANPAEHASQVFELKEFAPFRPSFQHDLQRFLVVILNGLAPSR
jgi:AcrR family transcriptional regulator